MGKIIVTQARHLHRLADSQSSKDQSTMDTNHIFKLVIGRRPGGRPLPGNQHLGRRPGGRPLPDQLRPAIIMFAFVTIKTTIKHRAILGRSAINACIFCAIKTKIKHRTIMGHHSRDDNLAVQEICWNQVAHMPPKGPTTTGGSPALVGQPLYQLLLGAFPTLVRAGQLPSGGHLC